MISALEHGGGLANSFLLVPFNTIALVETGVATNMVRKIWNQFGTTCTETPTGSIFCSKLSAGDLELIETLKKIRESISLRELQAVLADIGDMQDISLSTLSKAIKSKFLSGKKYLRKKTMPVAKERFMYENMVYIQLFINNIIFLLKTSPRLNSSMKPE